MTALLLRQALGAALLLASADVARAQHLNAASASCRNEGTTIGLEQCFARAGRIADGELNRLYGRIGQTLQPADRARLQAAERAWIQYRDATCLAEAKLFEGGTEEGPASLACVEAQTRGRISDLHAAYDWRLQK